MIIFSVWKHNSKLELVRMLAKQVGVSCTLLTLKKNISKSCGQLDKFFLRRAMGGLG